MFECVQVQMVFTRTVFMA